MRIGKRENVYEYLRYTLSEGVMEGSFLETCLHDGDIFQDCVVVLTRQQPNLQCG